MVGTAGIEPATPAMSMQCSPAELRALEALCLSRFGGVWQALEQECRHFCGYRQNLARFSVFRRWQDHIVIIG